MEGRSTGLQWFLSFYLVFLVESQDTHSGCILLLDEPGLSLHPLAQRDLSDFFDVADCFKYRNKIGLDVALEALKECRSSRRCEIDDLWHHAKLCRMANVMKPYLEAMNA